MSTTKPISDNLVPEAYHLAKQGAIAMAEQDEFAARYLDSDQRRQFLGACHRVRSCQIGTGQALLDAVAAIVETR